MSPATVLYYVSGHGFGHARRSAEVIRALRTEAPDVNVYVRTSAPAEIFRGLVAGPVVSPAIDHTVVEADPLSIDWAATIDSAADLLRRRRSVVAREAEAVRELDPDLVLADVPFLAGDVAAALGRPCVAVSNFTWDWIFEPHRGAHPDGSSVLRGVRSAYTSISALLQLPFGHETDLFPQVVPVPLVARRGTRDPGELLEMLGIGRRDDRPRVLIEIRGGVADEVLSRAATAAPDFLFLTTQSTFEGPLPPGVCHVRLPDGFDYSDLLAISDIVLSKLGYGMIAECIAAGTRLLWPRRNAFREDQITEREAPLYLRMLEIPLDGFRTGDWREALDRAMDLPAPPKRIPLDGAAACAKFIADRLLAVR